MSSLVPKSIDDMGDQSLTLREARDEFYRSHGFPLDGGVSQKRWTPFACRDLKVYLPNFEWRRRALPVHDLHHVITGYAFSPAGEFEMAAWEFSAGRYPHALSTLFCLPLVGLGAVVIPRRTFAAFVRGRHSRTLYSELDVDTLLEKTLHKVRRECLPEHVVRARRLDRLRFAVLVSMSAVITLAPFLLVLGIWILGG